MSPNPTQAPLLATIRVLVVDDEQSTRKVVRTLLTSIGVGTIFEAADGMAGLDQIRSMSPDVVIVDWQMPGLDGPGLVRKVRSTATFRNSGVPIIMLTGHGERSRVVEAAQIGVNAFLRKPVSSEILKQRLLSVLDLRCENTQPDDGRWPGARKWKSDIQTDADWALAKVVMLD